MLTNTTRSLRPVLIHDWLTGMRGGEKCLESACRAWPQAQLFTLLHQKGKVSDTIEQLRPRSSALNRLPGWPSYYRYLLPLMPMAAKWPIPRNTDFVLSFSHCVAKAARPPAGVPHICYCFTPMRYAWHMRESYFRPDAVSSIKHRVVNLLLGLLRQWDRASANRVTHFVAISRTIQQRIRECYDRDSVVIYPPVDTEFYTPANLPRENFYLIVSALAPYKRFDLAIDACAKMKRQLIVIGSGQELAKLKSRAEPNIHFLGWQSDAVIRDHLRRCAALLFPAEEDFGIVPLEAQSCGAPVIAFGQGGATETVKAWGESSRPTGVLFAEQTVEAVQAAVELFEHHRSDFDPSAACQNAEPFGKARYERELFGYIDQVLRDRSNLDSR